MLQSLLKGAHYQVPLVREALQTYRDLSEEEGDLESAKSFEEILASLEEGGPEVEEELEAVRFRQNRQRRARQAGESQVEPEDLAESPEGDQEEDSGEPLIGGLPPPSLERDSEL
jgi:hypothetical protein